jgi:hypothetical protein
MAPQPEAVVIRRDEDGGWLVIVGDQGWLCGSLREARAEAQWLSRNRDLPIREELPK